MGGERRIELEESLESQPDDPSLHFNLGVVLWEKGEKSNGAEHFVISAKLNPQDGAAFRYLGDYYALVSVDSQRALKCYQRAVTLHPDDSHSGESFCDLLDRGGGKESLQIAICREASRKSPRAFWAFRRLGFLQLHQKKWSEAVHSLQHAIRGYPTCANLWEALGLAYQRLGMFTAALKSYGRAVELEESRIFSFIESGNISLMLGSFRKGVEHFQQALQISPQNVAAHYGLASSLLGLAKENVHLGAFRWGASLLEEASEVVSVIMSSAGNKLCICKLHGDIQLLYAKCCPWMEGCLGSEADEKIFSHSITSWKRNCSNAAISAFRSYQRALHLAPWEANLYMDVAIVSDTSFFSYENLTKDPSSWSLSEKMCLGGLLLEGDNSEFWIALGCLSYHDALRQHAFIRGLQLDISLAAAWAYLGKLYRSEGERQLAQQSFDRARSIDPSLALPWAGMSADADVRDLKPDEAYECCLQAVQILPLADFQIGLAKVSLHSSYLPSSEVFRSIRQALQRAPHYPESHNLNGLISEARSDYQSAIASFRLARYAVRSSGNMPISCLNDISINLARSLCKAGNASDAVQECEVLKKAGQLDPEGLQIYVLSLWKLGKNDMALAAARTLAANVLSMEPRLAAASTNFICRMMYYISGQRSSITSILKLPKDLFQCSKMSFTLSALHALDESNQLEPIVSSSRQSISSNGDIASMHSLIALSRLVKHATNGCLGLENGIRHLRKALHMYPNSGMIRNLLGYLLVSSKESNGVHVAIRCFCNNPYDPEKSAGLKSAIEILGAGVVACHATGCFLEKFSFSTCRELGLSRLGPIQQLQKCLHQEPWNHNTRYLLVLNYVQKVRHERYPQHLCPVIERLINVALANPLYLRQNTSYEYQKFQLLLCAAEICLQRGNHTDCVRLAESASALLLPSGCLFHAHLLLCRAFAAVGDAIGLTKEYIRCLELKTDCQVAWMCLKMIESQYGLHIDATGLPSRFGEYSKDVKDAWNLSSAVSSLVQGFIALMSHDFLAAEEFLAQACLLDGDQSCFFVCHGTICMELARLECDAQFLALAIKSFKKARETSPLPLPMVPLLMAQADASLGFIAKWEQNLHDEWFSWPQELRPAEIYFQRHLLAKRQHDCANRSSSLEPSLNPLRWVLQAIHLNPSCWRYWKVLSHCYG